MQVPPGATEIIFDPHVVTSIAALVLALVIVFFLTTIPISNDRRRGRKE